MTDWPLLTDRAGISRSTVSRFESDDDAPSLATFVALLRVLGGLEALDALLPKRPLDPLHPVDSTRQRARKRRAPENGDGWVWGDER